MKLFRIVFICFALSITAAAQVREGDTTPIIAEIYLAKANLDGKAGEAVETFLVTDVPIFCVVRLHSPGVAAVKMDLIAAEVAGVKPGTKVVSTSYTTKFDEDRVNFKGRPQGLWVAGRYRADIFIGEKKVRNIEFVIGSASTEADKPSLKPAKKPSKRSTSADGSARHSVAGAIY